MQPAPQQSFLSPHSLHVVLQLTAPAAVDHVGHHLQADYKTGMAVRLSFVEEDVVDRVL